MFLGLKLNADLKYMTKESEHKGIDFQEPEEGNVGDGQLFPLLYLPFGPQRNSVSQLSHNLGIS